MSRLEKSVPYLLGSGILCMCSYYNSIYILIISSRHHPKDLLDYKAQVNRYPSCNQVTSDETIECINAKIRLAQI